MVILSNEHITKCYIQQSKVRIKRERLLKEYNIDVQKLFLRNDERRELYTRVNNIMNSANFDKRLRPSNSFRNMQRSTNVVEQINDLGIEIEIIDKLDGQMD